VIHRVADLSAFVLITGESGTGKELVARAIHNVGNRSNAPFVAVSCGAIPENLIEAELFGHERGAFTGSIGARAGYLEQAGEGTLLLDEIGELSPNTQVKLLRVLQQREFFRLGSNRPVPLKARVLFATHRNLQEMVDAGTFRRDLFYRVNVVRIDVPSLRDRQEDIPQLARHLLERYAREYDKSVYDIAPDAMIALCSHDWPGNIRELENVIQRSLILANGEVIELADLPEEFREATIEPGSDLDSNFGDGESFEARLQDFKVRMAKDMVVQCHGNKTEAAKRLRVSRAYLHRLIRNDEVAVISAA
jgi:DNA-binding NtrC family response regulator